LKCNLVLLLVVIFFVSSVSFSQDVFDHPELDWKTIETKHFLVHFHEGTERTAREVAKIAESVYGPITTLYHHEPDQRVSMIIRDHDDYSNGGAIFLENRIEIWAPAMDFELRGTHPWLWNVVTHEFTHIVQIQTTMKLNRKFPLIYFQWIGYEKEQRPDVLYGYPNVIVSYPLSGFTIPNWFAEGAAQYNNPTLDFDYWDSHRDMILRMHMIDSTMLSWEEMAVFGKTSLGSESVYNSGFSLVKYIAEHYGIEKLSEISRELSKPLRVTIDGAIEAALGKTGLQLYEEWKASKIAQYKPLADSLKSMRMDEEIIANEGFANFYPAFSPDGSKIAYVSNGDADYTFSSGVYLYDRIKKTSKSLAPLVRSSISFSQDGQTLYYSKITNKNPHWSGYSDLFKFNIKEEKEEQLTHALRATDPKLSSDGKKLVYAVGSDGTLNIGVCDTNGNNCTQLTKFKNGEQVYTPVWSKDGKSIAFGFSIGHNQSVALIDSNGEKFRIISHTGDCRNPFFGSDSTLYYAWDQGGIYNIYVLNLRTGLEQKLTHVLGGAFLPTVNTEGDIAYASYASSGYKIAFINHQLAACSMLSTKEANFISLDTLTWPGEYTGTDPHELSFLQKKALASMKDMMVFDAKPYHSTFTSLMITPVLRFDTYTEGGGFWDFLKPGLFISSTDVIDRMNLFGGGTINKRYERDLFLQFEFKGRLPVLYQLGSEPTLSLEVFNITRTRNVSFTLNVDNASSEYGEQTFTTDVKYNLFEFDFSLYQKIHSDNWMWKFQYILSKYSQDFGSWVHPVFGVISSSSSTYLISNTFSYQLSYGWKYLTRDRDINPVGRSLTLKYLYEMNKYNPTDAAENDNGFRKPLYTPYYFHKVEFFWTERLAFPFPKHTLNLTMNAAGILAQNVDEFFDYYAGGLVGMRGYPFYAIGGSKTVTLNATYRFPIATALDFRFAQFYFKKLYASLFCDIGDAWSGKAPSMYDWKRDVGFELRLEAYSFSAFPTRIFFSGAYGLDKFSRNVRDINMTTVMYGQEWRFYLGVLFGFELNEIFQHQMMR
jgi:hypothetical protein